jgi:putative DNA primase/helicase
MNTLADIANRFGLKRSGRKWRGTCPACGYGGGAFVLSCGSGGKALGWCASCQDGDTIARALGGEAPAPASPDDTAHAAEVAARKRERAISLWAGSEPARGTPAESYLIGRGLAELAGSGAIGFRADTPHPNGGKYPAMIALVSDMTGQPVAVQRTFVTRDGRKASLDPVRATLGPMWGGVIRLHDHDPNRPLVIGEGTESSASAGRLMGLPAWAAISAGNLAKGLALPPVVRRVVVAADPDRPGRDAARDAWIRWAGEGRNVRIAVPTDTGDFNDLIVRGGHDAG